MRREFRILGYPDFTFSGLLNRKCLNLYEAEFHVSGTLTFSLGREARRFPQEAGEIEISPGKDRVGSRNHVDSFKDSPARPGSVSKDSML
jgi:hypothetical protein